MLSRGLTSFESIYDDHCNFFKFIVDAPKPLLHPRVLTITFLMIPHHSNETPYKTKFATTFRMTPHTTIYPSCTWKNFDKKSVLGF